MDNRDTSSDKAKVFSNSDQLRVTKAVQQALVAPLVALVAPSATAPVLDDKPPASSPNSQEVRVTAAEQSLAASLVALVATEVAAGVPDDDCGNVTKAVQQALVAPLVTAKVLDNDLNSAASLNSDQLRVTKAVQQALVAPLVALVDPSVTAPLPDEDSCEQALVAPLVALDLKPPANSNSHQMHVTAVEQARVAPLVDLVAPLVALVAPVVALITPCQAAGFPDHDCKLPTKEQSCPEEQLKSHKRSSSSLKIVLDVEALQKPKLTARKRRGLEYAWTDNFVGVPKEQWVSEVLCRGLLRSNTLKPNYQWIVRALASDPNNGLPYETEECYPSYNDNIPVNQQQETTNRRKAFEAMVDLAHYRVME